MAAKSESSLEVGPEYAICPQCGRAVPSRAGEQFCLNDGQRLVVACPACGAAIGSPYARHCGQCGANLLGEK